MSVPTPPMSLTWGLAKLRSAAWHLARFDSLTLSMVASPYFFLILKTDIETLYTTNLWSLAPIWPYGGEKRKLKGKQLISFPQKLPQVLLHMQSPWNLLCPSRPLPSPSPRLQLPNLQQVEFVYHIYQGCQKGHMLDLIHAQRCKICLQYTTRVAQKDVL